MRERGGPPPIASTDVRAASVAFRSERYLLVDQQPVRDLWAPLSGDYPTADGWIRLHCNFEHHRDAMLSALDAPNDRDKVTAILARSRALDVEEAVIAAGGCAGAMRSRSTWAAHPQAQALAAVPVVSIRRVGDAPARELAPGDRPLAGVRVLDLTRVIAGPVCGRVLSCHGADVLMVGAAHLPNVEAVLIDTSFGKRTCHLDLRDREQAATLDHLAHQADVFVQGYRPGALAGQGFGADELAERHPGLVVVNVSAYGAEGPWGGRRGFDSLVQMVSGIAHEQAATAGQPEPKPLPAQALDHATGWLAALGAITALRRQQREGGSWVVDVTLARTALWLDGLGRVAGGLDVADPARPENVQDLLATTDSPFGQLIHVRPVGHLAANPPAWNSPPYPLGSHDPVFSERSSTP
jgi:crotonobetainyl-CoA:carnitine CoA-transferase CaiB-like acyl-CoA transferase